jgi:hypothetical protein
MQESRLPILILTIKKFCCSINGLSADDSIIERI